jgi:hypothetical protein
MNKYEFAEWLRNLEWQGISVPVLTAGSGGSGLDVVRVSEELAEDVEKAPEFHFLELSEEEFDSEFYPELLDKAFIGIERVGYLRIGDSVTIIGYFDTSEPNTMAELYECLKKAFKFGTPHYIGESLSGKNKAGDVRAYIHKDWIKVATNNICMKAEFVDGKWEAYDNSTSWDEWTEDRTFGTTQELCEYIIKEYEL